MTKEFLEKEIKFYEKEREELLKKYKNLNNKKNKNLQKFNKLLIIFIGFNLLILIFLFTSTLTDFVFNLFIGLDLVLQIFLSVYEYKNSNYNFELNLITHDLNFNQKALDDYNKYLLSLKETKKISLKETKKISLKKEYSIENSKTNVKTKKLVKTK